MQNPVDKNILTQLNKYKDFNKAYQPNGLAIKDFDTFGATARTLLQFAAGYDDLVKIIRSAMIKVGN